MAEALEVKRPRTGGTMLADLKDKIETSLSLIGEVEAHKKPHRKGGGPVQPRVLPEEELVHEKVETKRRGQANRVHYVCSSPNEVPGSHSSR